MSQAQSAADRLPWLADEPTPPRGRGRNRELAGWAVAGALIVAGVSYWMGERSSDQQPAQREVARTQTTVPLPAPRLAEPLQPQVIFEPAPEVRPVIEREVPIATPRVERKSVRSREAPSEPLDAARVALRPKPPAATPSQAAPAAPTSTNAPLTLWPATRSQGSHGRIVRIGAYGSRLQAKLGWRAMVQAYPAVAHLPATVVETRNSRGRPFYRFQIGTTSQAHSEVLCQRMEKIRLSCAVVGLPWKPKGVER